MGDLIHLPVRPSAQATTPAPAPAPDSSSAWKALGVIFLGLIVVEGVKYWAGLDTLPSYLPRRAQSRIARR